MNKPPNGKKNPLIINRKRRSLQVSGYTKSKLPEDIQALLTKRRALSLKINKIQKRLTFFQSSPLEEQLNDLLKEDMALLSTITDALILLPTKK